MKTGILDTLQDRGRFGFAKWGINSNGAMDQFAMNVANALVGNDHGIAVMEIHFPGPEILFSTDALVSLTGADFSANVNDQPIPIWKSIQLSSGSVLRFSRKLKGMRCYLAIHGGFEVAPWLGSVSTNLKSHTGGFEGRGLKKNDELTINSGWLTSRLKKKLSILPWSANTNHVYDDNEPILFTAGNEWGWLDESSQKNVLSGKFSIASSSDRMGIFLLHETLQFKRTEQLLSSAVTFGTIQALPSGKLCVLMADHQTTGGYPRVGHIISSHLPRFAQLSPGEKFSLKKVSVEEAEKMLFSLQSSAMALATSLKEKLNHRYAVD